MMGVDPIFDIARSIFQLETYVIYWKHIYIYIYVYLIPNNGRVLLSIDHSILFISCVINMKEYIYFTYYLAYICNLN